MSSFVINKKEYMKVAGFIAGLQAEQRGSSWLYWYNLKEGHLYTDKEIIRVFYQLYMWNAISVMEQYEDTQMAENTDEINGEFDEYKKHAKRIVDMGNWNDLQKAMYKLANFASCYNYQTENEVFAKKGMTVLNEVLQKIATRLSDIMGDIYGREKYTAWGDFNLTEKGGEE